MVVFTETETQGSVRANAFCSQPFAANVRGEKDADLYITIVGENFGIVRVILRTEVATENVGGILKNPIAPGPLPQTIDHPWITRILSRKHVDDRHIRLPMARTTVSSMKR